MLTFKIIGVVALIVAGYLFVVKFKSRRKQAEVRSMSELLAKVEAISKDKSSGL